MRTNTQIPISFGRDETDLIKLFDEGRKRMCISRSAWVKQKIREEFGNGEKEKVLQEV